MHDRVVVGHDCPRVNLGEWAASCSSLPPSCCWAGGVSQGIDGKKHIAGRQGKLRWEKGGQGKYEKSRTAVGSGAG